MVINNNSCNFRIIVLFDSLKLSKIKRLTKNDIVVQKRKKGKRIQGPLIKAPIK